MHSTLSDGSVSKHDQPNNDSTQSSDSSTSREMSVESDSGKHQSSGQSSLSLTLSLPNQSELLPIAEEKDSPSGSSKIESEYEEKTTQI